MKLKLLLFSLLMAGGILNAQDTIRSLVISEARISEAHQAYVEFTNVGDVDLNLADFEFGVIGAWTTPWDANSNGWIMLPDQVLAPNESFTVISAFDNGPEQWFFDPDHNSRTLTKPEKLELADIQLHFREDFGEVVPTDSVSTNYQIMEVWNGRDTWYIKHHPTDSTSAVIDQVNGIFDEDDGTSQAAARNIAGVTNASYNTILVRKFSIKTGNLDFEAARGNDLAESEWMPIPFLSGGWGPERAVFWTFGNHGDYNLDETTLVSSTVDVDFANKVITVPWGVRNDDSIMYQFERKPGIAWHYDYSPNHGDSAYASIRTGDMLTIFVCGNDLDVDTFDLVVSDPTADANIVVPMREIGDDGFYEDAGALFNVSDKDPVMDKIFEIPFGMHVDTMLKYLEKAPNATWEMVWVDGVERTAVVDGDILKVTAEDASVKEYVLEMEEFSSSHNAYLASVTWPDIPDFYRDFYGWVGDTIPNFVSTKFDYKVEVPADVDGIPALIAKTQDINATVVIEKATYLFGSQADKTYKITVTAEDDSTVNVYNIVLEKEKLAVNLQPWSGDPFISQFVFREYWGQSFIELVNPGNIALDMSNYMVIRGNDTPAGVIAWYTGVDDWADRYNRYIPGYRWEDETNWAIEPGIAIQDLNVQAITQPGDVFVIGAAGADHWTADQLDIDFRDFTGETNVSWDNAVYGWNSATHYLFKITNDSIQRGLKPATDPNDFELIDVWGAGDDSEWVFEGTNISVLSNQVQGFVRKAEFSMGNSDFSGSFGDAPGNSEWIYSDRATLNAMGIGWDDDVKLVADGLGSHFMDESTIGKSTVPSKVYQVSLGFSDSETIVGVSTGSSVTSFLVNIIMQNEGQILTLKAIADGTELIGDAVLLDGDSLIVNSADGLNTTVYLLTVSDGGLSDDAVLTSTTLTITATGEASVAGFDIGTTLADVIAAVDLPAGASLNTVDMDGTPVSLVALNMDTVYVDVLASSGIYLEVTAEDNSTMIVYQLLPTSLATDAYVVSSVFEVDEAANLIALIPEGTTVVGLYQNLIPATGATFVLVDKLGHERVQGEVVIDDKLVVTASDGVTVNIYYLSMLEQVGYLAYVLSDTYSIDQLDLAISGSVTLTTTVTEFLAGLIAAPGATMEVVNSDGTAKTGTDLVDGDLLKVTAGNGVAFAYYTIVIDYTAVELKNSGINVYPNPSEGQLYVSGLEIGQKIHVYSTTGVRLRDIAVYDTTTMISIDDQPSGMYFVIVSNSEEIVGRYKIMKR